MYIYSVLHWIAVVGLVNILCIFYTPYSLTQLIYFPASLCVSCILKVSLQVCECVWCTCVRLCLYICFHMCYYLWNVKMFVFFSLRLLMMPYDFKGSLHYYHFFLHSFINVQIYKWLFEKRFFTLHFNVCKLWISIEWYLKCECICLCVNVCICVCMYMCVSAYACIWQVTLILS